MEDLDAPPEHEGTPGLSEAEVEILEKAKRRNLIIAIVLGIVLLICGFFAGKAIKAGSSEALASQLVVPAVVTIMPAVPSALAVAIEPAATVESGAILEPAATAAAHCWKSEVQA